MHCLTDRTAHTIAFDEPVVDHWVEWKIAHTENGSTEKDQSKDRQLHRWTCYHFIYIPLYMYLHISFRYLVGPVMTYITIYLFNFVVLVGH